MAGYLSACDEAYILNNRHQSVCDYCAVLFLNKACRALDPRRFLLSGGKVLNGHEKSNMGLFTPVDRAGDDIARSHQTLNGYTNSSSMHRLSMSGWAAGIVIFFLHAVCQACAASISGVVFSCVCYDLQR
ncbi:MAG: hypothetical protein R8K50_08865 [Mariprofundus sp.]